MVQVHCNMFTVPTSINRNYSYRLIGYRYDLCNHHTTGPLSLGAPQMDGSLGPVPFFATFRVFESTTRRRPPRHLLIFDAHAQLLLPPLAALPPACDGTGDLGIWGPQIREGHEGGSQKAPEM